MRMKINIEMDNAAFHNHDEYCPEPELTRIFEQIVSKMYNGTGIDELAEQGIRDLNGNSCGSITIDKK